MKKKLAYLVIVYILCSISIYAADNKLKIATLATDKIFVTNKTLREEYLTSLKTYTYIKHKSLFSSDIKKVFAFKNNKITTNEAIKLASNMKTDFVFIFDVVTTIVDNTNTNTTNTSKTNNATNDFAIDISPIVTNEINTNTLDNTDNNIATNNSITNISPILAEDSTSTNENITNQITLSTNTTCTIYVFKPSTGEITRTEVYDNLSSTREKIDSISKSFETYLANSILNSIPRPDNDIDINFFVKRETLDNSSTILEESDELYNGDSITLNFDVNKNGYLYIMLIQDSGTVLLIHPNDFNTNFNTKQIPINADTYYSIPNEEDIFKINIIESKGIDKLFVIYTERAQSWFDKDFTGTGFKTSNPNTLIAKASSIKTSLALLGKSNYKIFTCDLKYYQTPVPIEETEEEDKEEGKEENSEKDSEKEETKTPDDIKDLNNDKKDSQENSNNNKENTESKPATPPSKTIPKEEKNKLDNNVVLR